MKFVETIKKLYANNKLFVWMFPLFLVGMFAASSVLQHIVDRRAEQRVYTQFSDTYLSYQPLGPRMTVFTPTQIRSGLWVNFSINHVNDCFVRTYYALRRRETLANGTEYVVTYPLHSNMAAMTLPTTSVRHAAYFISMDEVFPNNGLPPVGHYILVYTLESSCDDHRADKTITSERFEFDVR